MRLIIALYHRVLSFLGLIERRCGWCRRFLGFKRGQVELGNPVSHGMCEMCQNQFEADQDRMAGQMQMRLVRPVRQRRSTKNLRRSLGGWSGAAASRKRR